MALSRTGFLQPTLLVAVAFQLSVYVALLDFGLDLALVPLLSSFFAPPGAPVPWRVPGTRLVLGGESQT